MPERHQQGDLVTERQACEDCKQRPWVTHQYGKYLCKPCWKKRSGKPYDIGDSNADQSRRYQEMGGRSFDDRADHGP